MIDEIPEHIRAMTRRDVLQAVRDGVFQCRKLDGSEFTFPPADRLPRNQKSLLSLKGIVKKSQRLRARMRTYSEQDAHCFYCNRTQHFDAWTIDHKTPLSRGGNRKGDSNIVGACSSCNHQKDCLTLEEFLAVRHDPKLIKAKIAEVLYTLGKR